MLSKQASSFISSSRECAKQIVLGTSSKLAIIVGPCSIHNIESALIYAQRLKKLSLAVEETLFLVMRVYIEKARTTIGWKGFLYDPFLNGTNDIHAGLSLSRSLFLELTKLELPIATEFVNPLITPFFQDLVTWGFIGARTATSQIHRELASSFSFPIGFKNTLDGNLSLSLNSIVAANTPHSFIGINEDGLLSTKSSLGNLFCHLVLRGSECKTNYAKESLYYTKQLQESLGIYQPIMVDCAHGNSGKNHLRQKEVFEQVAHEFQTESTPLSGIMLESFLEPGNQPIQGNSPNLSITDPCLGWDETEKLILSLHESLSRVDMKAYSAQ